MLVAVTTDRTTSVRKRLDRLAGALRLALARHIVGRVRVLTSRHEIDVVGRLLTILRRRGHRNAPRAVERVALGADVYRRVDGGARRIRADVFSVLLDKLLLADPLGNLSDLLLPYLLQAQVDSDLLVSAPLDRALDVRANLVLATTHVDENVILTPLGPTPNGLAVGILPGVRELASNLDDALLDRIVILLALRGRNSLLLPVEHNLALGALLKLANELGRLRRRDGRRGLTGVGRRGRHRRGGDCSLHGRRLGIGLSRGGNAEAKSNGNGSDELLGTHVVLLPRGELKGV